MNLQEMLDDAVRLHQAGQFPEAERLYRQVLAADAGHADALHLFGVLAHQTARNEVAIDLIGRAIAIDGTQAAYHANLGIILKAMERPEAAVVSYQSAIRLDPDNAEARSNLGAALKALGRPDEAASAFMEAVRLRPDFAEAHCNLGVALDQLGRTESAIGAYEAAILLNPDLRQAHFNLAVARAGLGRLEDAVAAYEAAIRLDPDDPQAHLHLAATLTVLGRLQEAVAACDAALRLKPDSAQAHYNQSHAYLLLGDLASGWPKYEWRWRRGGEHFKPRGFTQPQWRGEDLVGKTILLHTEQGVGDVILFCRYIALVAERGGRVVLQAPRRLLRLLAGLAGVDRFVAVGDPLPDFDCYCPLMSLPGVFGTTTQTIPAGIPYLAAEPDAVDRWRARIGSSGFRIGITWQGNPTAPAEQGRSAPLAAFAPLAKIAGVRLISLQKVHGLDQLDDLPAGLQVETLGADFDVGSDAFMDTAAAMMSLDLIVTVDTAAGHLAGALGRPVWLALQKVPHWVWTMEGERTPWYLHHRLFRQAERGDWDGVFERMATELRADADTAEPGRRTS